jgi:hypothetical protein
MNDGFVGYTLDIEARARRAERPEADCDAEDPVYLSADGHEAGNDCVGRQSRGAGRDSGFVSAAGEPRRGDGAQKVPSVHDASPG